MLLLVIAMGVPLFAVIGMRSSVQVSRFPKAADQDTCGWRRCDAGVSHLPCQERSSTVAVCSA